MDRRILSYALTNRTGATVHVRVEIDEGAALTREVTRLANKLRSNSKQQVAASGGGVIRVWLAKEGGTSSPRAASAGRPPGFRDGHGGDLACPHRDLSCCDDCAKAHPEIVESAGRHYWVNDPVERELMQKLAAKADPVEKS